jgi:MATE family multidrug resistance protein
MEGAAWATTCAQWCRAITYGTLVVMPGNRRQFNTLSMRWEPTLLKRLVKFGGPSGVQMMLDVGGFTIFVLLVSKLGPLAAEATSAAFTVSHVAFMPVWGLGMATVVLVGQHLGEDRPHVAQRATRTTFAMAVAYMGAISLAFTLAPDFFLANLLSHSGEAAPADDSAVRALATNLLFFVAAYNLFDATVIIFVSALKGAGDTRFIMKTSVCMAVLLAGATWAGINYFALGVYGSWTIITLDVWALAVIYLIRYRQGKWRSMRVIDQVHHGHALMTKKTGSAPPASGDRRLAPQPLAPPAREGFTLSQNLRHHPANPRRQPLLRRLLRRRRIA